MARRAAAIFLLIIMSFLVVSCGKPENSSRTEETEDVEDSLDITETEKEETQATIPEVTVPEETEQEETKATISDSDTGNDYLAAVLMKKATFGDISTRTVNMLLNHNSSKHTTLPEEVWQWFVPTET